MQLYKVKRDAKDEAIARVFEQGRPATPYKRAHITITFVGVPSKSPGKRQGKDPYGRDLDNLFASMKAYIDGLVFAGLIEDDSVNHVSYTLRCERGDKNNTIIEVDEEVY